MQKALFTCFSSLDQIQAEVLKENMNENESWSDLKFLWAQLSIAIQPEYSHKNADERTFQWQEAGDSGHTEHQDEHEQSVDNCHTD